MPETVPSTVFFVHDGNEVYTSRFKRNMVCVEVEEHRPLHGTSFWESKCFKGMSVTFIMTHLNFHKDEYTILLCDNIQLSSLDSVVGGEYLISLFLKIAYCHELPSISSIFPWSWVGVHHREERSDPENKNISRHCWIASFIAMTERLTRHTMRKRGNYFPSTRFFRNSRICGLRSSRARA